MAADEELTGLEELTRGGRLGAPVTVDLEGMISSRRGGDDGRGGSRRLTDTSDGEDMANLL